MYYADLLSFCTQSQKISDYLDQNLHLVERTLRFSQEDQEFYYFIDNELIGRFSTQYSYFTLIPILLDRPLVLALKPSLTLLPYESRTLSLERPISVELKIQTHAAVDSPSHAIHRFPLVPLKMTSYGKVQKAMLCYYWESRVLTHQAQDLFASVPIDLKNESKDKVSFQKLIISKNYLQLYILPTQLLTCAVHVKITSKQDAYIKYEDHYPSHLLEKPIKTVSDLDQNASKLLKKFKTFKRKGTGIEYGF
jgi:hypothetical protein